VTSKATARFWACYQRLPGDVQRSARERYALLLHDPLHPLHQFREFNRDLWSVRINPNYRALARLRGDLVVWFWIGTHAEYDKLVSGKAGAIRKTQLTWKAAKTLLVCMVVACLPIGCYLQQGGWMMIGPRYTKARLLGLTPDEVIRMLGKPSNDPRVPWDFYHGRPSATQPHWRGEAEDGPLFLAYYQGWATCRVDFKDGHVVDVQKFWK
jgi:hypothetical protein